MQRYFHLVILLSISFLNGCVGVDLVDVPEIGERLRIEPRIDSLAVGEEFNFEIRYSNQFGIEEITNDIMWSSSDTSNITIDSTGRATVLSFGETIIYATNGRVTDSLVLNSNRNTGIDIRDTTFLKSGTFQRISSSYNIVGGVRVQTVDGVTEIITSSDFSVSPGPSLYVLLTNHTLGSYTVTPNSHAVNPVSAQITPNRLSRFSGSLTWAVPSDVNPSDYKFVVFYCTLGPVFGAAELN